MRASLRTKLNLKSPRRRVAPVPAPRAGRTVGGGPGRPVPRSPVRPARLPAPLLGPSCPLSEGPFTPSVLDTAPRAVLSRRRGHVRQSSVPARFCPSQGGADTRPWPSVLPALQALCPALRYLPARSPLGASAPTRGVGGPQNRAAGGRACSQPSLSPARDGSSSGSRCFSEKRGDHAAGAMERLAGGEGPPGVEVWVALRVWGGPGGMCACACACMWGGQGAGRTSWKK